jgi:alpha-1,2-mannosyltransferase
LYGRGDELAGVTVTGLTACLISPISWVHHLYWVVPAAVVLVDVAAGTPVAGSWARARPEAVRAAAAVAACVVVGAFGSSLVWFFPGGPADLWSILGDNAYVLLVLATVVVLPARIISPASTTSRPAQDSRRHAEPASQVRRRRSHQ